jgi:small conductance mechanosensitive channel
MNLGKTWQLIVDNGIYFGMKVLSAIAIWIIGRWLIGFAVKLTTAALARQQVDATLLRYVGTIISGTLTIILIVAILGFFGVETASFAAMVAAAGVAIGMAWSGLLANFAASAFMMVLRPIKLGDEVTAGGITGVIKEIGLFATSINTQDNVLTSVGNNKIFSDTIHNFSANPYRRVDLKAQLTDAADHKLAIKMLKERVSAIANVLKDPPPDVAIMEFNGTGPLLLVRPYCNNAHYWQVHADTNQVIKETMIDGNFPGPVQEVILHNRS